MFFVRIQCIPICGITGILNDYYMKAGTHRLLNNMFLTIHYGL